MEKNLENIAAQVLTANGIDWIPLRYIYNVRSCGDNRYELSFISGGSLTLSL